MYITDVIKRAKALHPTEYSDREYIHWCDELSAEIMRNYDEQYSELIEEGSSVLLPPDVDVNDIAKIVMDGKELIKTDLRDYGVEYRYSARGRELVKVDDSVSEFRIIYRVPYEPIRYIDEDVTAVFGTEDNETYFSCTDIGIYEGDTFVVTEGETSYTIHIMSIVTDDEENTKYFYEGDVVSNGEKAVHFFREIQDETLLPAPYDTAYMDFCNAKVALYQADSSVYNAFMNQYQAKLADYARYITRNKPRVQSRFKNWM